MITIPLIKVILAVLAGIIAFLWGALAEQHLKSRQGRVISFSLLIVYAVAIGLYLFYF